MSTVRLVTYETDRDTGTKIINDISEFDLELNVLKSGKFTADIQKVVMKAFQQVADSSGYPFEVEGKPKYEVSIEPVLRG